MAEWNAPLPETAEEGDESHVEDHNAIVDALHEVRTNVDTVETAANAKPTWDNVQNKPTTFPPDAHSHDVTVADVSGLEAALEGKADSGDIPNVSGFQTAAQVNTAIETATSGLAQASDIPDVSGFLTEAQVQALIDAAIESTNNND